MLSRVISLSLFLFSTYIWVQGQASAPAPSLSQEAFILEHWNESVRFENDGSGVRETTAAVRIQSQAGVQEFGQLVF